jgi:hypothetical protein
MKYMCRCVKNWNDYNNQLKIVLPKMQKMHYAKNIRFLIKVG